MRQGEWEIIATVPDTMSAQALLTYLEAEGVPSRVQTDTSLLGEARRCDILVPPELSRRARSLLAQGNFTDAELTFLATGELDSGAGSGT
jgi:hypothetical protein